MPEHTLPAYALAYGQGAHWIETDLVVTADHIAIALHDLTLDRTTNVQQVFAGRARDDGKHYAADFTYAEIRQLVTVERREQRFPHSTFGVPRFEDVLELVEGLNRTTGCRVGIYPELKAPARQPALARAVLEILAEYDLPVLIQSFDAAALKALQTDYPLVQLIGRDEVLDESRLDEIAIYADVIGPAKRLVYRNPAIVAWAHDRGLAVHAYTLSYDWLGEGFSSFADEVTTLTNLGVDAIFTDHPDKVLELVGADRRCSLN